LEAKMKSFLTGSRAYGTPKEDSDYDVVVSMSQELCDTLRPASEAEAPDYPHSVALRFGKLNLICAVHPVMYEAWRKGNELCLAEAPITHERAIEIMVPLRLQAECDISKAGVPE